MAGNARSATGHLRGGASVEGRTLGAALELGIAAGLGFRGLQIPFPEASPLGRLCESPATRPHFGGVELMLRVRGSCCT